PQGASLRGTRSAPWRAAQRRRGLRRKNRRGGLSSSLAARPLVITVAAAVEDEPHQPDAQTQARDDADRERDAAVAVEAGVAELIPEPDTRRDCGGHHRNQHAGRYDRLLPDNPARRVSAATLSKARATLRCRLRN